MAKSALILAAQGTKRLTPQDLFSIKIIETPKISPDGQDVLFVQRTFNTEKNEYLTQLFLIPYDSPGASPEPFTQGPLDSEPRFSPDGNRIAFLRKVGDFPQLFVIPRHGGESKQITHFKNNVTALSWSPDGTKIAFIAAIAEKGLIPEDQKPEEEPYKKYNEDVKVVRRIWYKLDGTGFLHNKRHHLFFVEVESGKITQLTFGEHDASSPEFSPDGQWITFASNRNADSDYEPMSYIYVVPLSGGEPKNLTPGNVCFTFPSFSPDGKTIAFIGNDEPANWYANLRLWIVSSQGGTSECLTPKSDFCVANQSIDDLRGITHGEVPKWSRDSQEVFISASDRGRTYLIAVKTKNKTIRSLGEGDHVFSSWDLSALSGRAVVSKSDPLTPNDLWSLDLSSGKMDRLTEINAEFLQSVSIGRPEAFTAQSFDGTKIDGWILKPPDFQEGQKYPAVLEIHGGPMGMYAYSFFYEFQLLAHQGVVVVYSNPRGSFGYGQPFCEAIKGDWGNLDYKDVMAVLDGALAKGFIDQSRLGIAGGSYGGFMTNWAIGHTDRFKAAVTMRSVVNEHSFFGTSDYGFFGEQNLGCLPWEKPEAYLKMSPITYVKNIKTPLLILHSEEDYRCPMEQAEQLFAALKKLKQEVLFVRFPGESHDLSRTGKPWHRIYRFDQILAWFESHL